MAKNILIIFMCLLPEILSAQWNDNFSDGDFEDNPPWQGNIGKFIVDNGWLRLNDQTAGTSYLSVVSDIVSNASWEFVFKLNFNPSSSNYAKVYLISDKSDLTAPLNGYFLRIGYTDDDICLFRQNNNVIEKLISGRKKALDVSSSHVRVLVTRDSQGHWTLMTDMTGSRNFELEGGAQDNLIRTSACFGVVCIYTATRGTGFMFTDFKVDGQPYTDTEPPVITSSSVDGKQISIRLSEVIAPISSSLDNFFSIDESTIPATAIYDNDLLSFTLSYTEGLKCGIRHKLSVRGLSDLSGNVMRDTVLNISLPCRAAPHDIVINEIMANPSPSVRLPEYEYIELYNRSDKNIELEGWTFTYGNTSKVLPQYLLPTKSYLLLVHPAAVSALAGYGATLPVLGSQTAITNAGQYLQLTDREETVISWVDFTSEWYFDALRANGGWSLEQIDPEQTCSLASNWQASTDKSGGTPGRQNSALANHPDHETPDILRIAIPDAYNITLYTSKPLGSELPDISRLSIEPPISVNQIQIAGKHFDQLKLQLASPIQEKQWYDLYLTGGLFDCAGYEAPSAKFRFTLPQYVDSLDVVINEILFNPVNGGYAFIELYNRSQKAVQANDLLLALRDVNGKLSTPVALTDEPFLLLPSQYLVVSRNTDVIMQQFGATNRNAFLQMSGMPSLTKESGRIVLLSKSLRIVDEVHYNSKQHSDFLNAGSGVSLERLHPDRNSLDSGNWHTAAQTAGFGTPGRQNSQYMELEKTQAEVSLTPEIFSPDNDGIDDFLMINYHFDIPSLMGEVIIFDSSGRKIKQLAHQELLAVEGIITWDGTDDKGRKMLTGIYIIYFQAYNSTGFNKIFKIPCVLAGKKL